MERNSGRPMGAANFLIQLDKKRHFRVWNSFSLIWWLLKSLLCCLEAHVKSTAVTSSRQSRLYESTLAVQECLVWILGCVPRTQIKWATPCSEDPSKPECQQTSWVGKGEEQQVQKAWSRKRDRWPDSCWTEKHSGVLACCWRNILRAAAMQSFSQVDGGCRE